MKLYTLGYQGLSLEEYIRILRQAQVGLVLDVRDHAWSQRPEFVKTSLKDELANVKIKYLHIPYVGNPRAIRKQATSATACLRKYKKYVLGQQNAVERFHNLIKESAASGLTACLTCYEEMPENCHRSILVELLLSVNPRMKVVHLPLSERRRSLSPSARNESLQKTAFLQLRLLPL